METVRMDGRAITVANSGNCCLIPIEMRNCPICVLCVSTVVLIRCRYASLIVLCLLYGLVIIICCHAYVLSKIHHKTFQIKVLLYVFWNLSVFLKKKW